MKSFKKVLFAIICFSCFLILSCERDEVYNSIPQPVDTLAKYSFASADSPCILFATGTDFFEGKLITSGQKVEFEVKVTSPGKWSAFTDTLNGFFLRGAGNFPDTGRKVITLTASGTPTMAGTEYFTISTGLTKRKLALPVIKSDIITEAVPYKSYFKARIGDSDINLTAQWDGPEDLPYGRGGRDTVSFASFIANPYLANPGSVGVQKGNFYNYSTITEEAFKKFFKPGSYPFAVSGCGNIMPSGGITINWGIPPWNDVYTTTTPGANQSGSSFRIIGVEDGHTSKGKYFVKVRAKFNCRIFNARTGEMKVLTDGEIVSYFFKD